MIMATIIYRLLVILMREHGFKYNNLETFNDNNMIGSFCSSIATDLHI